MKGEKKGKEEERKGEKIRPEYLCGSNGAQAVGRRTTLLRPEEQPPKTFKQGRSLHYCCTSDFSQ